MRALTAVALSAAGLLAGCAFLGHRTTSGVPSGAREQVRAPSSEVTTLFAEATSLTAGTTEWCANYPYLKFELPNPVVSTNLCQKNDPGKPEGIIYRTIAIGQGAADLGEEIYMVVHATGATPGDDCVYEPFAPRLNGMQGKYASINLKSGSNVHVQLSFHDRTEFDKNGEDASRLTMEHLALTFFDLDTGKESTSVEYIRTLGPPSGFKEFHLTTNTEVVVTEGSDGTKFSAGTYGDGEDNPKDPMFLTDQQKNRAVTLIYENVDKINVEMGASDGIGPRFFTFVGRASVLCAVSVQEDFVPPLDDLVYTPPMHVPIKVATNEKFVAYTHEKEMLNREVELGEALLVTDFNGGTSKTYRSPVAGKIIAYHKSLKVADHLDLRLSDRVVIVIERHYLEPLEQSGDIVGGGPGEIAALQMTKFNGYKVHVGDIVAVGDVIGTAKDQDHTVIDLLATAAGQVVERHEELDEGDYLAKVRDWNIITVGPIPPLATRHARPAARVMGQGLTFKEWERKEGDTVKHGDVVATAEDADGNVVEIKVTTGGIITAREPLKPGVPLDRLADHNLITTGMFAPLERKKHEEACRYSHVNDPKLSERVSENARTAGKVSEEGLLFDEFLVAEGDEVKKKTPVAILTDEEGSKYKILAPKTGTVTHIQKGLQKGMIMSNVMEDASLATIGPLAALKVGDGEAGCYAPASTEWTFQNWSVAVGDDVEDHQQVALLMNSEGKTAWVKASKPGTVTERQELLSSGDIVRDVTEDGNILTIGKFAEPSIGFMQEGVTAKMDDMFDFYLVKEGKHVNAGDPVAQVTRGVRRLTAADGTVRRLAGTTVKIPSPGSGTVSWLMPLKPGKPIGDQSVSPNIAKIDIDFPWWILLLILLLLLLCCLAALFMMKKKEREPDYKPVPVPEPKREEPKPEPVPEPAPAPVVPPPEKPDGLRMDFDDGSSIKTVYAKYRPLGIVHHSTAPIVAHDFTVNSYAKMDLGVKDGWKLVRVGDTDLRGNSNFEEVDKTIVSYMKDFPLWPLHLEFRPSADSSEVHLHKFTERPIGIKFHNVAPIRVETVFEDSPAKRLGVELNWYLTKIGTFSVQDSHNFLEVMKVFKEGVEPLEDNGKKYS